MHQPQENKNFTHYNELDFSNYDQCFDFFTNAFDAETIKFYKKLTNEIFLGEIIYQVGLYANECYIKLKNKLRYRLDDQRPFTTLLTADDGEDIFNQLFNEIKKHNQLAAYHFLLEDLNRIYELVNYFREFKNNLQLALSSAPSHLINNSLEDKDHLAEILTQLFQEYEENALALRKQLLNTHYKNLVDKLQIIDVNEKKQIAQLSGPSMSKSIRRVLRDRSPENIIYYEPDGCYRLVKPPLSRRIKRYIDGNTKKLILGAFFGILFAAAGFYFFPISLPLLILATFIVTGVVFGGVVGSFLMGISHYLFSSKARRFFHSTLRVEVNPNEIKNEKIAEIKTIKSLIFKKDEQLEEQIEKNNLLRFIELLESATPISVLASLSKQELVGHIKFLFNLPKQDNELSIFEMVKKYLQKKDNLFTTIDFDLLEKTCMSVVPNFLDLTAKDLQIEKIKTTLYFQKMAAFSQLVAENVIDLNKLQPLSKNDIVALKRQIALIKPVDVAVLYFLNLSQNNQNYQHIKTLYNHLFPQQKKQYEQEDLRIRNMFFHFINKIDKNYSDINMFSNELLVSTFIDLTRKLKPDTFSAIYSNMILTASPKLYNLDMIPIFIQVAGYPASFLEKIEDVSHMQSLIQKKPLLDGVKLFLLHHKREQQLALDNTSVKQLMDLFYDKLDSLNVNEVLVIFEQIRFNTFTEFDFNALNEIITCHYQKTNAEQLKEYYQGINKFSQPSFIKEKVQPNLVLISSFLSHANIQHNVTQLSADKLLPLFFITLQQTSIENFSTIIKQIEFQPKSNSLLATRFLFQLAYNYFAFKRPKELNALSKTLQQLENDQKQAGHNPTCSIFHIKSSRPFDEVDGGLKKSFAIH